MCLILVLQRSNARGSGGMMRGADHVAIDMGGSEHAPLMNEMNQMQALEEQVSVVTIYAASYDS